MRKYIYVYILAFLVVCQAPLDGAEARTLEFIDAEGNVRSGPGTGHSVLFRPDQGTRCRLVSEKGAWLEVKFDDGKKAWVHKKNVKNVDDAGSADEGATAAGDAAPVRSGSEGAAPAILRKSAKDPNAYELTATVVKQVGAEQVAHLDSAFRSPPAEVYEVRVANDDRAYLCVHETRLSAKQSFSLPVRTAGLKEMPSTKKEPGPDRTVPVYEEAE